MPGGIIPPLDVYETWPKPNYIDPVTEGPALVIIGIVLSGIATLLVAARIYSRLFITQAPGIDDILILISLASAITLTVLVIICNEKYGSGRHAWDVPPSQFVGNRRNVWISEWFYILASCSAKISILLFYRRLSSSFTRFFFVATWIGIVYNVCYLAIFLFLLSTACRPIKAYWLQVDFSSGWPATHEFTCVDEHRSLPASASLSVLGDLYSTIVPCILILQLDLPRRQKLALYPLFLVGFAVVAAGSVRVYFINYLINETYDNTWYLWKFWIYSFLEIYLAIIAASAPALKPFFCRFLVEPITSRTGGSTGSARNHGSYLRREGEARGKFRSNASRTMPLGETGDVEKIRIVVNGDDTRKYELRTLPSGKVEPVQIDNGGPAPPPRRSEDLRSESPASSLDAREHTDWALPPTGLADDRCSLRAYRAGIESLPPVPGPGRPAPAVAHVLGGRRSVTPTLGRRRGSPHDCAPSMLRYSAPSPTGDSSDRDRSDDLIRRSSQGSVKAARLRAAHIREAMAARRAGARMDENPDHSDEADYVPSAASASDETLGLPRQGLVNRDSSVHDDKSLHLPRHGVTDEEKFRASRVGLTL